MAIREEELPGGKLLQFERRLKDVEDRQVQSPAQIAAAKLEALRIVEDSLGLGDYDSLINQLLQDIRNRSEAVANYRLTVKTIQAELDAAEAELALPINSDKVQYPNEAARKSGIERAKTTNTAYQSAARTLQDAQNALDTAQLDLDMAERQYSAIRGARMYAGERLRVLASL